MMIDCVSHSVHLQLLPMVDVVDALIDSFKVNCRRIEKAFEHSFVDTTREFRFTPQHDSANYSWTTSVDSQLEIQQPNLYALE